ncbi:MAG: hypothetical protein LBC92_01405, partial [Rickettsiales bacterium]|nr:hypothetical protein [Rickettsiales bacterium]
VFSIKSQINNDFVSISESDTFLISFDDFVFNNKIHPYKNWISHVKKGDKGYEVLLIIAMFFVSGKFSRIDMNVKKFDNGEVFKIIKNLFNG